MPDLPEYTPLRGRRLLVVEDEYLIAQELRQDLIGIGAVVVGPVPSVAKALQIVESDVALDGAILDINLGGEMVFPLVDVLRHRNVPIVFLTGYDRSAIPVAYADIPLCRKPANARDAVGALGLS